MNLYRIDSTLLAEVGIERVTRRGSGNKYCCRLETLQTTSEEWKTSKEEELCFKLTNGI